MGQYSIGADTLVIILLVASAVSAFTGEVTNFLIIGFIVLLSVTLDFVQEYRANTAAEKLRQSVSVRAIVMRDGKTLEVPVTEVVPGDVALLSAGDMIPADGRVVEARDLFVKQALLTGESHPVEKRPGVLPDAATELQEATNAVFMGTSVISGSARMLVVKTGTATAIGEIADSISRQSAPTSFDIGSRRFGMLIMRLTILMVMFVLLVNTFFHKPWLESFLFAVALAVGLTPELLPMVVSVTLSRGALRMAKQHMIVKRLSAIQDLGSMDVLCTDKTGTLTEAKVRLERHVDGKGRPSERVLELAYFNSFFETGLKSPLDDAILAHQHIEVGAWKKIDEVPFDFERRRVSVLIDNGETRWLVVKGAPDEIVGLCTQYEAEGAELQKPIDEAALAGIHDQYHALEKEGFRVLGIAWRQVPPNHPHAVVGDETELVLAGFAAFLDPPKESAASALAALEKAGVAIKIVTGDSDLVTRHVCNQLKIPVTGLLTGKEIAQMDDHALRARVETANLFCRVNPSQKDRIILALKARGHVVGYLGDGINDAPSLHSADVGLSVDSAVDVAKEAADMILLKQDLHVLYAGVLEGRRTFGNIMKYIKMTASSNFGNVFSVLVASAFLPFLPMLPLQILVQNLLYDISQLSIPFDRMDDEYVRKPRKWDAGDIGHFMVWIGPVSSIFDITTFWLMWHYFGANSKAHQALFQSGWFIEGLLSQTLIVHMIRTRRIPFLQSVAAAPVLALTIAVILVGMLIPFSALGAKIGMMPLPPMYFAWLALTLTSYCVLTQLMKLIYMRRYHGRWL